MSTRFLQVFNSAAEIDTAPESAGVGVVGGIPFLNTDGNPRPLGLLKVVGKVLVVNPALSTSANGIYSTIQAAVNAAIAGATILVAPGAYDETVTVPRVDLITGAVLKNVTIIGVGARGSVYIQPSTEDAAAMLVHADDVTIVNIGCEAEDETSAAALTVTGSRFRAYGCKLEGGATQLVLGPGTVAQEAAGTRGRGSDALCDDCEFCWGTKGIVLQASDFGAVTQARFRGCKFHNLTASHIDESAGSGGSAAIQFRNLEVSDCTFDDAEGGTAPTKYVLLNDDNGNDGIACNNRFPTAINSTLNLVSTALHWVGNFHTGGLSTAQPS